MTLCEGGKLCRSDSVIRRSLATSVGLPVLVRLVSQGSGEVGGASPLHRQGTVFVDLYSLQAVANCYIKRADTVLGSVYRDGEPRYVLCGKA